jgi:3-phenylpropionate/trans-cinnamate dioxygenase ferredoxin subunit
MEHFIKVANVAEVKPGKARLVHTKGVSIAVFNSAGVFYAIQGHCSGDGASLSDAILRESVIVCARDGAQFYLPTGECIAPHSLNPLVVYPVRIDGDSITIAPKATLAADACSFKDVKPERRFVARSLYRILTSA